MKIKFLQEVFYCNKKYLSDETEDFPEDVADYFLRNKLAIEYQEEKEEKKTSKKEIKGG